MPVTSVLLFFHMGTRCFLLNISDFFVVNIWLLGVIYSTYLQALGHLCGTETKKHFLLPYLLCQMIDKQTITDLPILVFGTTLLSLCAFSAADLLTCHLSRLQRLLGASGLCQLSQECPYQPRSDQDSMLLFFGTAKSDIGAPCLLHVPMTKFITFSYFLYEPDASVTTHT